MINVGPSGFNPRSLPPVQREWRGGVSSHGPGSGAPNTAFPGMRMMNSSGGNTPGNLPMGQVDSSRPGRGNLPPMGPMGGGGGFGGGTSMMGPMGFGGGQGMVQGPSFMQQPQQPQRNRMAGGMVDPNFRRMMEAKAAGGMGSAMAQRPGSNAQHGPGAYGVSPSTYYQHFDRQGMPVQQQQPQQQQQMGMGGGDPMQQMMQFWQMYQQMLGNRGQQGY